MDLRIFFCEDHYHDCSLTILPLIVCSLLFLYDSSRSSALNPSFSIHNLHTEVLVISCCFHTPHIVSKDIFSGVHFMPIQPRWGDIYLTSVISFTSRRLWAGYRSYYTGLGAGSVEGIQSAEGIAAVRRTADHRGTMALKESWAAALPVARSLAHIQVLD